jgi:nucleotide-binding universal stress UspA family protein
VTVLAVDDGWADTDFGREQAMAACAKAGVEAKDVLVRGKPAQVILEEIEERPADLVVLGKRGMAGWRLLRLGSTAAPVARAAPCSVLIAQAGTAEHSDPAA